MGASGAADGAVAAGADARALAGRALAGRALAGRALAGGAASGIGVPEAARVAVAGASAVAVQTSCQAAGTYVTSERDVFPPTHRDVQPLD